MFTLTTQPRSFLLSPSSTSYTNLGFWGHQAVTPKALSQTDPGSSKSRTAGSAYPYHGTRGTDPDRSPQMDHWGAGVCHLGRGPRLLSLDSLTLLLSRRGTLQPPVWPARWLLMFHMHHYNRDRGSSPCLPAPAKDSSNQHVPLATVRPFKRTPPIVDILRPPPALRRMTRKSTNSATARTCLCSHATLGYGTTARARRGWYVSIRDDAQSTPNSVSNASTCLASGPCPSSPMTAFASATALAIGSDGSSESSSRTRATCIRERARFAVSGGAAHWQTGQ